MQQFKYFAFISYSSKDTKWGRRVQRRLEHYKLPVALCRAKGLRRKPMKPVFFAPTDIQPGVLSEELKQRLRDSRHLIVICSPNSAQSEWVGKEISYFNSLGRGSEIYFFIVDGEPHSGDAATECFNPAVAESGMPEILAANIHERNYRWPWLNKERAYIQLISKLLGVEFDAIWHRHRRAMIRRAVCWAVGAVTVASALALAWRVNRPVDVDVRLDLQQDSRSLPPMENGTVTLHLDNEIKQSTLPRGAMSAQFANIPRKYIGREVRVSFVCEDFIRTDTVLRLDEDNTISICRDPAIYGDVRFRIYDIAEGRFVTDAEVMVDGKSLRCDTSGVYSTTVPLERQATYYVVQTDVALENDTLVVPCGDNAVLMAGK